MPETDRISGSEKGVFIIMFKALLKKQLTEVLSLFLRDKKTGAMKQKKSAVITVVLFVVLFIFIAFAFGGVAFIFLPFLATPSPWLYFALLGTLSVLYGVFGSVFNTYAGIYHAKDNDTLLSMPIPPRFIILARASGVAAMSVLYGSMVLVPTIVVRFLAGGLTVPGTVFMILLVALAALFITSISTLLGWVVAVISSKLKNKSFLTVIIFLAVIGVYFYFCGNSSSLIKSLITNSESVASKIKVWLLPFYLMGRGVEGDIPSMLGFTAITFVFAAIALFVLTKTFTKIVTTKADAKKKETKIVPAKSVSADRALLRRERMKLTSSPTYMINCCLGSVFLIVAAVVVLIKKATLTEALAQISAEIPDAAAMIPVIVLGAVCMIASMNTVSAPSVSLEGKNIWIAQSLPVHASKVLNAKIKLHLIITAPPAMIAAVCVAYAFGCGLSQMIMIAVAVLVIVSVFASLGIILNLKHPNLVWTNETVPVKQSMSVMIVLFGGWAVSIATAGIYILLRNTMEIDTYLSIVIVVFALLCRLLLGWITKKRRGDLRYAFIKDVTF